MTPLELTHFVVRGSNRGGVNPYSPHLNTASNSQDQDGPLGGAPGLGPGRSLPTPPCPPRAPPSGTGGCGGSNLLATKTCVHRTESEREGGSRAAPRVPGAPARPATPAEVPRVQPRVWGPGAPSSCPGDREALRTSKTIVWSLTRRVSWGSRGPPRAGTRAWGDEAPAGRLTGSAVPHARTLGLFRKNANVLHLEETAESPCSEPF